MTWKFSPRTSSQAHLVGKEGRERCLTSLNHDKRINSLAYGFSASCKTSCSLVHSTTCQLESEDDQRRTLVLMRQNGFSFWNRVLLGKACCTDRPPKSGKPAAMRGQKMREALHVRVGKRKFSTFFSRRDFPCGDCIRCRLKITQSSVLLSPVNILTGFGGGRRWCGSWRWPIER